jgi:hypothetical protein
MDSLAGAFGFAWEQMTGATGTGVDFVVSGLQSIGGWLTGVIDTTSFVIDNWGALWGVAYENAALTFTNLFEQVKTWGINVSEIASWVGGNFSDIMSTATDAILTIFINLGTDIRNLWQEIIDYIWSMGENPIEFNVTPMLEGFKSTIREMPQLTKAEIQETTAELDRLNNLLGENAAAAGFGLPRPQASSLAATAAGSRKKAAAVGQSSIATAASAASQFKVDVDERQKRFLAAQAIGSSGASDSPEKQSANYLKEMRGDIRRMAQAQEKNNTAITNGLEVKQINFTG